MLEPKTALRSAFVTNYANFIERAPRSEYLWFHAVIIVINLLLGVIMMLSAGSMTTIGGYWILDIIYYGVLVCPTVSVHVRRLHDLNYSGWWLALPFALWLLLPRLMLPMGATQIFSVIYGLVGVLFLLFGLLLLFKRGTVGHNRYGDDPLSSPASENRH